MRTMTKPPLSVLVVSGLLIVAGSVGLAYHATELHTISPFPFEAVWVCLVRLLAIACGVFLLRGRNWARWGVIVWLAYHVVLGALHSAMAVVIHTLLLAVIGYLLMRPRVSAYFRGATALVMLCLLSGCQQPPAAPDLSLLTVDQLRTKSADPDPDVRFAAIFELGQPAWSVSIQGLPP